MPCLLVSDRGGLLSGQLRPCALGPWQCYSHQPGANRDLRNQSPDVQKKAEWGRVSRGHRDDPGVAAEGWGQEGCGRDYTRKGAQGHGEGRRSKAQTPKAIRGQGHRAQAAWGRLMSGRTWGTRLSVPAWCLLPGAWTLSGSENHSFVDLCWARSGHVTQVQPISTTSLWSHDWFRNGKWPCLNQSQTFAGGTGRDAVCTETWDGRWKMEVSRSLVERCSSVWSSKK
jgi:hypothetical protein